MKHNNLKKVIKENLILENLKQRLLKESNGVHFNKLPHGRKMKISYL